MYESNGVFDAIRLKTDGIEQFYKIHLLFYEYFRLFFI